jgi:hypothetical protein
MAFAVRPPTFDLGVAPLPISCRMDHPGVSRRDWSVHFVSGGCMSPFRTVPSRCLRFRFLSRLCAICIASLFFSSFISPAAAQMPAGNGILPFSTQVGGPYDSIDLANGGLTFFIPVRTKAGKIPFSFKLVGHSAAAINTDSRWYAGTWFIGNSFSADLSARVGWVRSMMNDSSCGELYSFSNFGVTDATGASHPVPGASASYTTLCALFVDRP